jgi:hypothetical protein
VKEKAHSSAADREGVRFFFTMTPVFFAKFGRLQRILFAFLKGTGGEDFQIGDNLEVLPIGPATKGLN